MANIPSAIDWGFLYSFCPFQTKSQKIQKMVEDGAFSHKIDYVIYFLGDSKSWKALKSHYWFKSYGISAEWVDFAYSWRFSGGGSVIIGDFLSSLLQLLKLMFEESNPNIKN